MEVNRCDASDVCHVPGPDLAHGGVNGPIMGVIAYIMALAHVQRCVI